MRHGLHIIISIAATLVFHSASAQFYVTGDNPGRLKWYTIDTDNYRIIYPGGCDSLARTYAVKLETFRLPVSRTTGYLLKGSGNNLMPVVLHAYNHSNGSVAWAPKRMDLFTIPSAHAPVPMPWSTMLSVHESRHVTQMQFAMTGSLRPFNWFFGEMFNILASLIYPGISIMEGDAVIAETAFTNSGRGRTADFLNYYRIAFDNGDFRSWDKWRFVSQRNYSPSYYSLGYMTLGGFRMLYDCPELMSDIYHLAARRPYNLLAMYTTTKKLTGKNFGKAFMEVCDTLHGIWTRQTEERAPFMFSEPVSKEPRLYTDYSGNIMAGDELYAIKSGHLNTPELVLIGQDGNEKRVARLSSAAGRMQWSENNRSFYWSEDIPDIRWTMKTGSKIRYIKAGTSHKDNLTKKRSGLYYNPYPSDSDGKIASVKYLADGKTAVAVMDDNGKVLEEYAAPDGLQTVEPAFAAGVLYVTAISEEGYGIYRISGGRFETVLGPVPAMIKDFGHEGELLTFTSDRTGVNEIYHFDPQSKEVIQKTVTRYGASDFHYSPDGKYLYYSSPTMKGMRIFRTPSDSLISRKVNFREIHKYPIAEAVTEQERRIAAEMGQPYTGTDGREINIPAPKRYSKLCHAFNVHSWTPFYVNVDNIMNMSFDKVYQAISLGAAGIMQNRLSNAVGEFGYSAHKDPYNPAVWRHSGHARFTYSGLYPVLEAKVDINDRAARQSSVTCMIGEKSSTVGISSAATRAPYAEGEFSAYIPFKFSSGGWHSGIIPKLSYNISNDRFDNAMAVMKISEEEDPESEPQFVTVGYTEGKNCISQTLSGSFRAYTMLGTSNSAVYPRWGAGIQLGTSYRFDSKAFISPAGYAYFYGYIPGFTKTQGLRLSVMRQHKLDKDKLFCHPAVNVLPRGCLAKSPAVLSSLTMHHSSITKFTADYAVPIYIGDLSIGGSIFSIKRLVLTPNLDFTMSDNIRLFSAGADLALDMNSILTLEWPCSIGITYSHAFGPSYKNIAEQHGIKRPWYIGPVFNVTF